jgi:hypothetical protein
MTKHNYQRSESILYSAFNTPRFHRIIIEPGVILSKILCVVRGPVNISGGTTNGVSAGENPGGLISRFEIDAVANSSTYPAGKLKNVVPRGVLRKHVFDKGFYRNDLLNYAGISGAAGTPSATLLTAFDLRFCVPGLAKPIETGLRLDQFSSIMLKITTGIQTAMLTGNDRVWDISGVSLEISEFREYAQTPDQSGKLVDFQPPVVLYEEDIVVPITAAMNRMPFDQFLSPGAYHDIVWIAETTGLALSDAILSEIFMRTGSEQFFDQISDTIKAEQQEYLSDQPNLTGLTAQTGLYYTPLNKDLGQERALLGGAVPNVGAVATVAHPGTDQVTVSTRRFIPVPA